MPKRAEIVSRLYNDGWGREDFEVVFECLDPGVVWMAIEGAPDAGTYRGHEGARAYIQDWLDQFRDFHWKFLETIEVDDRRIVCVHTGHNTSRRTGLSPPPIHYAGVYTFRNDKIVEIKEYATREEALRAALGE
jgi:ketosteroid isomerase-like protein